MKNKELNKDLYDILINDNESCIQNPLNPMVYLDIEPFRMCNYNCKYCYLTSEERKNKKEINYDKLYWFLEKRFIPIINKNIYEKLKIPKKIEISLRGGELSIKPLEWNINFIKNLMKIFKDFELNIIYLTNLFRNPEYYISFKQLKRENFNLTIYSTFHPEFQNFEDFLKKVLKIHKNDLNIELQYFGTKEDLYKKFSFLKKELNYCFKNKLIHLSSIDHFLYQNFMKKYKKLLRPVICYAYSYEINYNFEIRQTCDKQKFSFFKFDPKLFYVCEDICQCSGDEIEYKKILRKK